MNRRQAIKLAGLGLFSILPGASRVWKVQRPIYSQWQAELCIGTMPNQYDRIIPILYARTMEDAKKRLEFYDQPRKI